MARGQTETPDAPTENGSEGEAGAQAAADTQAGAEGTAAPKRERSYIVVPLTPELKERFESEAKAADNKPVGPYFRDLLFGLLGIPIPETTVVRHSKYASKEEREAAQKERNKNRSTTMKTLLERFRQAQKTGVSDDQAADLAARAVATGQSVEELQAAS